MDVPHKSEAEQQAYFESVYARAIAAQQAVGTTQVTLRLVDTTIRLAFAGAQLISYLLPALAHLRTEPVEHPDVTLHLWDSASTGIDMLPPPCRQTHFTDRGDIWGFTSKRFKLAFHWSDWSVNLLDMAQGIGIYWTETAETLPYWVKAAPLRSLLHWWMEKQGCQLLHAAAVATDAGAMLITGKGGVGKSTTALACLSAGLTYLGDDYLLVGLDPEPRVYSLYSTAKLNPDQMAKFPHFTPLLYNPQPLDDEKAMLFLQPHFAAYMTPWAPLKAITTPCITAHEDTTFAPISKQALQRAAAFTTLSQLPYAGRQTHAFINRLVHSLPGAELRLGSDLTRLPDAMRGFLTQPPAFLRSPFPRSASTLARDWPLVTVIIPVYNGAHFLPEAIQNVLAQDYPALEIIVVNDGSTDNTSEVVQTLPIDVRYFEQENMGPAAARNRGIKDASGDFVAFLDVDDLWPENNLYILADVFRQDPGLDVVHGYGQLMEFDDDTGQYDYVGNPGETFPFYLGAGLYRRAVFETVGLFDPHLQFAEDTDWFARGRASQLSIRRLNQVTLLVRRHTQNMTRDRSLAEMNPLRLFKKLLDRQRQQGISIASQLQHR